MTPIRPVDPFSEDSGALRLSFDNNGLAAALYGVHHDHLARIESSLNVAIHARSNQVAIVGDKESADHAAAVLGGLYDRLKGGLDIEDADVDAALRLVGNGQDNGSNDLGISVKTSRKRISPRSPVQADYLRAIDANELVFGIGPAGTGKTYLAVAKAVERLISGEVQRIILSRPAVEAGEQLGFLPGDMREKVDPYLRPLYDALYDMMPGDKVVKRLERGDIEVAPLAFMRGRTLANAFVILDEAQNTTAVQMKMFLTRLGRGSRMVVTGDLTQVDLPRGTRSGLRDAVDVLDGVTGSALIRFSDVDVIRHPLVARIVNAYAREEKKRKASAAYEQQPSGDNKRD